MLQRVGISCSACGIRQEVPYVKSRNDMYSWEQYHGIQLSLAIMVTKTR